MSPIFPGRVTLVLKGTSKSVSTRTVPILSFAQTLSFRKGLRADHRLAGSHSEARVDKARLRLGKTVTELMEQRGLGGPNATHVDVVLRRAIPDGAPGVKEKRWLSCAIFASGTPPIRFEYRWWRDWGKDRRYGPNDLASGRTTISRPCLTGDQKEKKTIPILPSRSVWRGRKTQQLGADRDR